MVGSFQSIEEVVMYSPQLSRDRFDDLRKSDAVFNLVRDAKKTQNNRMAILSVIFSWRRSVWKSVWKIVLFR